ncbi:MAG: 16S rRNA (cytidine(1402)-2'-O)-methyltransferase [Actinobacteria bacterium]|nr:16S rRNA (cytidine(1402)-2'-O)-methyltransferase [Actinomycetota bacterium]MBU1945288.1 16S rRNA (cytidine(1402)-2'-O)-methyltransferase [Actinomycetota bacterium]MBU2686488.1 16S rRNA (cytidine(1402)-2'-O)-methyltransferase [Actinomycetota bacterium]
MGAGTLFLCATPIGNLTDVTIRVLDTLREVDVVAAEDTRRTRRLLQRYDIRTPMLSYREENREAVGRRIVEQLEAGESVGLVSDAGTPGVSDPGSHLVALCLDRGIRVESLPGPNAAISALVVSGLPTRRFSFEGFPPRKKGARRKALEALIDDERTLIFYESPNRTPEMLADVLEVLGDRRCALARELTKRYEEVLRGTVSAVLARVGEGALKGEVVLVVEGAPAGGTVGEGALEEALLRVEALVEGGAGLKEASASVAAETPGVSRGTLYNLSLERR